MTATKKLAKSLTKTFRTKWQRPFTITIRTDMTWNGPGRRVSPGDLSQASILAAQTVKTYLESRRPTYELIQVEVEYDYAYRMASNRAIL